MSTAARVKRLLVGDDALGLLLLAWPTVLAIVIDLVLRARTLFGYAPQGKFIYLSSWLISAAFWVWPSWLLSWLLSARARHQSARGWTVAFVGLWMIPFTTFCFAGQPLYYRVFNAYVGRDTVRLGIALRGTVMSWFASWGGPSVILAMLLLGSLVTLAIVAVTSQLKARVTQSVPVLPILTFLGAFICFWVDAVDSRYLQAATFDTCFVHGAVHALRVNVMGKGGVHQGLSIRTPLPLPPLASERPNPPNILIVLLESVRADALCSEPPPGCQATFLDKVAPDRVPLGRLTTQTPNTFTSFLLLTTGLCPNVDLYSAHSAPVLWEVAHAVGYRTVYVSAQNPKYEDFGVFTERAGIDDLMTAIDLGGMRQEQLGAPDERATDAMIRVLTSIPADRPYFAVLHLSNTHDPYRTDPALSPFLPESTDPLGDARAFHNHYRNSVLLLERTVSSFLGALRLLPSWDRTVALVLSDHGEAFRDHGRLYHNHTLYDEEIRIPGFLIAGHKALSFRDQLALFGGRGQRTFTQDVHATVLDLLGVSAAAQSLPLANLVGGQSLLRSSSSPAREVKLLATSSAVWEADDPLYGAMLGERKVVHSASGGWMCIDVGEDRGETRDLGKGECSALAQAVDEGFARVLH